MSFRHLCLICSQKGDYATAAKLFGKALALRPDAELKATLHRNRALARLKLEDFAGAEADCTEALALNSADTKALYRRAQARQALGRIVDAAGDASAAYWLAPHNEEIAALRGTLIAAETPKAKESYAKVRFTCIGFVCQKARENLLN